MDGAPAFQLAGEGYVSGVLCKVNPDRVRTPNPDILRKEVIQPQVPLRLPCYDFTLVADLTVVGCFRS